MIASTSTSLVENRLYFMRFKINIPRPEKCPQSHIMATLRVPINQVCMFCDSLKISEAVYFTKKNLFTS
jgi:hypothetical protein